MKNAVKQSKTLSSTKISNSYTSPTKRNLMSKKQQADMTKPIEFSVRNMGSILEGKFKLKPLTVFCGPNNSGKTWVMYALRAFFDLAETASQNKFVYQNIISKYENSNQKKTKVGNNSGRIRSSGLHLFKNRQNRVFSSKYPSFMELFQDQEKFTEILNTGFASYFNASPELFKKTHFKCHFSKKDWDEWISNFNDTDVFLMPAERNGLHLFYRELSAKRTALLHHVSKANVDIDELLRDVRRTPYAKPIADYIDWLNQLTDRPRIQSDFHKEALFLQKNLVQGAYSINRQTGEITYKPYKTNGLANNKLGLHVASSTVKSLFGLWFYLEYQAKVGDVLMIDEPELNIHPENQLVIARLLARLVKTGIRVVISTHSDYIVREFNNLLLLNEDKDGSLKKEHNYQTQEVLNPDEIGFYLFDNNTIKPFDYTPGQGFAISTFDEVISMQNFVSNDIYFELLENGQEENE